MHHPFSKILASSDNDLPAEPKPTRRDALRTAVQVGAGALAVGVVGDLALAQGTIVPTTFRAGEEGSGERPMTPHSGLGGDRLLEMAKRFMQQGRWEQAARILERVEKLPKPTGEDAEKHKGWQEARKKLDEQLKEKLGEEMNKASEQAKAGKLRPALKTYRIIERVGDRYGLKQRAESGIAKLAKMEGYDKALKKVKEMEARHGFPTPHGFPATRARHEGGGEFRMTTGVAAEEGGDKVTTFAIGEEG